MGDITVPSRLAAPAGPSSGATGWCGAVHGSALTHEEMEFIAEEERVQIVPLFSSPRLTLLGGEVGPFRAQARAALLPRPPFAHGHPRSRWLSPSGSRLR